MPLPTLLLAQKPFGRNGDEARALSGELGAHLQERQIFRIDHYLAKTLVTNLLAFRFANRELGRLFHADNVANVRITFKVHSTRLEGGCKSFAG